MRSVSITVLALTGFVLLATDARAQLITCWWDDAGARHCGDSVPAKYAHSDREILNSQGIVIRREQGEITPEERAIMDAEMQAREAQEREAQERARYGQMLLDSYTSVAAIETLRDRNLKAIDNQIEYFQGYLEDLRHKLEDLNKSSQRYAPHSDRENAPPLPKNLSLDIEATGSSIEMYERLLEDRRIRKDQERENFEKDIKFFKELQQLRG